MGLFLAHHVHHRRLLHDTRLQPQVAKKVPVSAECSLSTSHLR